MSESLKISGKKFKISRAGEGAETWSFEARPGGWLIATRSDQNGPIERKRLLLSEAKGRLSGLLSGTIFGGEIVSDRVGGGAGGGGDSDLIAQFPGKVRKILVSEGATVSEGEPLVLVEAMKMEFSVKAPAAGKVKRVLVKEGQQLSPGDRFVDFDASGASPERSSS